VVDLAELRDVAQRDGARDEGEPVLVLLAAGVLPRGNEHQRDEQDEGDLEHPPVIGRVRPRP